MEKEEYEHQAHRFVFSKPAGKHYCVQCGLIALNNGFSDWATEKGCLNEIHPSYKSTKRRFTKLKGT